MASIQVLPKAVADMIAAGEVVERPASAAKELIENAIDAGATEITVEVCGGGIASLRVTDNGGGIPPEEVPTAFLRHATSKLRTAEELSAIGTLGFRGEALAAIAAVSRTEMLTKTPGAAAGYAVTLEGGVLLSSGEAGCPEGTTVVVRRLFYNVPARYKFLKNDSAEASAVHTVVQREALAHPEVAFRFLREGEQVLSTPGDGVAQSALYAVLGRELARDMVPVTGESEGASLTGYVSRPTACKGSRSQQHFFINGRWIRSRLITAALENAYRNQKMTGRFPAAVLYLTVKPEGVDVNSHPTKTEVKFVRDKDVYDAVYYGVLRALEELVDRPVLSPQPVSPPPRPEPVAEARAVCPPPAPPEPETPEAPPRLETEEEVEDALAAIRAKYAPDWSRTYTFHSPQVRMIPMEPLPQEEPGPEEAPVSFPAPAAPGEEAPDQQRLDPAPAAPHWRMVGEVLNTYIIVEQGETVLFIDKHAAHERMNFDRLKAQGAEIMSQELLAPVVWRPSPEDGALLLEHTGLLEELGFELSEYTGGCMAVNRVPCDISPEEAPETLAELAAKLRTAGRVDPAAQRDALLHTMACKAAIKGGQRNDPQELLRVAQAVLSGQVTHCPHGRPVATQLTRTQLERQFKRS